MVNNNKLTKSAKLLLVEDDLLMVRMYQRKFLKDGYDVRVALDGREGLDAIKQGYRPDLILLDIMMPRMNGFQFLEEKRKDSNIDKIPVVLLTNLMDTKEIKSRTTEFDIKDYIVKSEVSMEDVVSKVDKVLKEAKTV